MIAPRDHSQKAITGVVLAGGRSTRMGRDKAAILLPDSRTMMQHVIDALAYVCRRVISVGPSEPSHAATRFGLHDARPDCGPLAGIETTLASGIDPDGAYLICACDAPLVPDELLQLLANSRPMHAAVLHVNGRPRFECMPLRINATALPIVRDQLDRGELAVWRTIEALDPVRLPIDESQAELLRNINTPDELTRIIADLSAAVHSPAR